MDDVEKEIPTRQVESGIYREPDTDPDSREEDKIDRNCDGFRMPAPSAHPVQGLQVELFSGLGGDKAHGRPLHGLGDGLRIAVVVFIALEECPHIFGGHESGVVA